MKNQLMTSLWVGEELPVMAQLCIKSFLAHGHSFQLFTYKRYDKLPQGVLIRDAREILPAELIFRDSHGSYAPFSDWFRMKFLAEEGGFWVDMDVVCLSEEAPAAPLWFCREQAQVVAVGGLRFPAHHPIPTALALLAEDPARHAPWDSPAELRLKDDWRRNVPSMEQRRRQVPWGFCGPSGMTRAVNHYGLFTQAAPPSHFYPIPWTRWRDCFNGCVHLSGPELSNAWAIHLWGEMLRREPDAWQTMRRHSVVGELLDTYLPELTTPPPPAEKKRASILVGICSCVNAAKRRAACRETWLSRPQPGVECRFFLGHREPLADEPDVVALWVEDDYEHLPAKGLAFYKWALDNYDFDWLFKCDDDTYLSLERLPSLCDERFDLIGDMSVKHRGFPSGGAGYLMKRALVEAIVARGASVPLTGPEDVIFGQMARSLGAACMASPRLYLDQTPPPHRGNDRISCHWCSPERLRAIHAYMEEPPVAVMSGVHPYWKDEVLFFRNGRYMRKTSGCTGDYLLRGEKSLILKWDRFAPETLEREGEHFRQGQFTLSPLAGHPSLHSASTGIA